MAGTQDNGGVWRAFLGGAAALAVIAAAVVVTLVGNAQDPAPHMISSAQPNHPPAGPITTPAGPASTSTPRTSGTTVPVSTTTLLPPVPTTIPLPPAFVSVVPTVPATTAPPATPPTVALTGPTVVSPGGRFQWHSRVTGAVSGTWSGTVLDEEQGAGSTSRWSFPSGVFVWDNPSVRLAGGTYTITLTVYNRAGASARATATVSYPRS